MQTVLPVLGAQRGEKSTYVKSRADVPSELAEEDRTGLF